MKKKCFENLINKLFKYMMRDGQSKKHQCKATSRNQRLVVEFHSKDLLKNELNYICHFKMLKNLHVIFAKTE